jgi:hypothetical protein
MPVLELNRRYSLLTAVALVRHHNELLTLAGCNTHLTLVLVSHAIRPTGG